MAEITASNGKWIASWPGGKEIISSYSFRKLIQYLDRNRIKYKEVT